MTKISLIGLGFVGSAMLKSFKKRKVNIHAVYDKFKDGGIGNLESNLDTDISFWNLPTIFDENKKSYDLEPIYEVADYFSKNNYTGLIIIKSTIIPETTIKISKCFTNLKFIHNPEFLTARTAYEDFDNQEHIVLGFNDRCTEDDNNLIRNFYNKYYPDAEISTCSCTESESMKIFVNSFYAVKIQFFNELFLVCQQNGACYKKVKEMMLKNGWINKMHTNVPGPDGKLSYGGLCFPKDTHALLQYMKNNTTPHDILQACVNERNILRDDFDNYKKKNEESNKI
jgi:UDPglucose 6-dehydrogenase